MSTWDPIYKISYDNLSIIVRQIYEKNLKILLSTTKIFSKIVYHTKTENFGCFIVIVFNQLTIFLRKKFWHVVSHYSRPKLILR